MSSERQLVTYEARDGRAYITLNRAEKYNALTFEMIDTLVEHVVAAEKDDDVRVVIFRAEGKNFSAGHDLSQVDSAYGMSGQKGERRPSQRIRLHADKAHVDQFRQLFYCMKPTMALIRGHCVGAGLHLVETMDLAIASTSARIGHPEQKMALAGAAYMTALNILAAGPKKARELLLIAEQLTPAEAVTMGLVNKVVPDEELESAGEEWAERIVRLPRDAIAIGKAATHLALDSLGMSSQFIQGYITHALGTNIRYEADELNFAKARRDKGVRSAVHTREDRYEEARQKSE